jgi:hypothetical protein
LFFFLELVDAKYKEIPIKKYNTDQTIGKIKPGGVIDGLTLLYHSLFDWFCIKIEPIIAVQ